jgi:photosystem II stability/assembly factor-like uncharacterized protein
MSNVAAPPDSASKGEGDEDLYAEDFETGPLVGWELEPGWEVTEDVGGNHVLRGQGHRWARYKEGTWGDFALKVRIKIAEGGIHINYRVSGCTRYFVGFHENGLYLAKTNPCDNHPQLRSFGSSFPLNRWYDIEIAGERGQIDIYVDGEPAISYFDPEPLTVGGIAFETLDDSDVYVDGIVVVGQVPPTSDLVWTKMGGPLGGLGYDVRMRPDNPSYMYVTDSWSGVNVSVDGGLTWYASNEGIITRAGPTGDAVPIFSLTIDPHNADVIWVGTQNTRGIFKSSDGGKTWVEKTNGVVEREGITFRGITVDPGNPQIVYAAAELSSFVWAGEERQGREFDLTKGVVYKTTDGGQEWKEVWRGDNLARYIWIDPRDPDVLYVSTGIFDREAANSVPNARVAGGEGVLKSIDGGQTWKKINNGLKNLYVGTMFMHPENPDVLLAGTGNNQYFNDAGVYLSENGGDTWEKVSPWEDNITSVEFALSDPNVAYAGSAGGVYRSEDRGRTWLQVSGFAGEGWGPPGVRAGFPIDFLVDPNDPNRIYANNYGGGNFLSTDGGRTWTIASAGYTGAQVRDIAIDPTTPQRVFAAARSGLFCSGDGGGNWEGLSYPPSASLEWNAVAVDPSNPNHLLAANNWEAMILESHDSGRTWHRVSRYAGDGMSWRAIAYAPSDTNVAYAGTGAFFSAGTFDDRMAAAGVFVSQDGGSTWAEANDSASKDAQVAAIAVDPHNPQVVYAATTNLGLLKSSQRGGEWRAVSPSHVQSTLAVGIHPENPAMVCVGTDGAGLYCSEDGATSWQPRIAGLNAGAKVTDIVFDPVTPTVMYVADFNSGVYQSEDGGRMWVRVVDGLNTKAVNALAISSDGSIVYAATEGEGVFRLDVKR